MENIEVKISNTVLKKYRAQKSVEHKKVCKTVLKAAKKISQCSKV